MKMFNLFVVILSLTMAVACGDKSKSKNQKGLPVYNLLANPNQIPVPTTQVGTMNMQSGVITAGSQSFLPNQIAQQGAEFANTIFNQLRQNPFAVTPISQGVYRIQITGYAIQGGGYPMQGGYQQFPQQYPQQNTGIQLVITAPIQPLNRER